MLKSVVVAAATVLVGAGILAAPATAAPRPALDTTTVVPHTTGVLTGHDFPAGTTLRLTDDDDDLTLPASVVVDSAGTLSVPYTAGPSLHTGRISFTARETGGANFLFTTFLDGGRPTLDIGNQTVTIEHAGVLHVRATGFAAGELLDAHCACTVTTPTGTRTDARGAATFDVRVSGPKQTQDPSLFVFGIETARIADVHFTLRTSVADGPQDIDDLLSDNGLFTLDTLNGRIETYERSGSSSAGWWQTGLGVNSEVHLTLQNDGNLVLRDTANRPVWNSRTAGTSGRVRLVLQGDGNLVLRSSQGRALWASGTWLTALTGGQTMGPGRALRGAGYLTTMQTDGNLVQRLDQTNIGVGAASWSTHTLVAGSTATLQTDGNLVVRAPGGRALWSTGTAGRCPSPRLVQQFDRNLVLRSSSTGRACWTSGTAIG